MSKFKEGQLVRRLGHTSDYIVKGYNGNGMVIVNPHKEKESYLNQSIFFENQLKPKYVFI